MRKLKRVFRIIKQDGFFILYQQSIERIYCFLFKRQMAKSNFRKAIKFGEKLIMCCPDNKDYHLKLAQCYQHINDGDAAYQTIERHLNLNLDLTSVIKQVECAIDSEGLIDSKYVYLGGSHNGGCFEHKQIGIQRPSYYITKISTDVRRQMEKLFYMEIYNNHPTLKKITPALVSYIELPSDTVSLITMERINGESPIFSEKMIMDAIDANMVISSIKKTDVSDWLMAKDYHYSYQFDLIYKRFYPIKTLETISQIHKEETNKCIFEAIFKRMRDFHFPQESINALKRLERLIMGNKLYTQINPGKHYSLQHGDFREDNMMVEKSSGKLYILDWGYMRIGPSWYDLASFLGVLKKPFNDISRLYLANKGTGKNLSPIEKLFFAYTLVVVWFMVFDKKEFNDNLQLYILPAIQFIETEIRKENLTQSVV